MSYTSPLLENISCKNPPHSLFSSSFSFKNNIPLFTFSQIGLFNCISHRWYTSLSARSFPIVTSIIVYVFESRIDSALGELTWADYMSKCNFTLEPWWRLDFEFSDSCEVYIWAARSVVVIKLPYLCSSKGMRNCITEVVADSLIFWRC